MARRTDHEIPPSRSKRSTCLGPERASGRFPSGNFCLRGVRAAGHPGVCAAAGPRAWIFVDPGLLGLRSGGLLLGARNVGAAAAAGPVMDARLLGLARGIVYVERR